MFSRHRYIDYNITLKPKLVIVNPMVLQILQYLLDIAYAPKFNKPS